MDARRETLSQLSKASNKVASKMTDAAKAGDVAEMIRLLRIRRGLRTMMEPMAAAK